MFILSRKDTITFCKLIFDIFIVQNWNISIGLFNVDQHIDRMHQKQYKYHMQVIMIPKVH